MTLVSVRSDYFARKQFFRLHRILAAAVEVQQIGNMPVEIGAMLDAMLALTRPQAAMVA